MIPGLLGLVLGHKLAALGLAVKLAAFFVVNLAGSIGPDHSLDLRVSNLLIRRRRGLLGGLSA